MRVTLTPRGFSRRARRCPVRGFPFAQVAQEQVRGGDILARWGGEEFLLMMPDTPTDQALHCVQRIHPTGRISPSLNGMRPTRLSNTTRYFTGLPKPLKNISKKTGSHIILYTTVVL